MLNNNYDIRIIVFVLTISLVTTVFFVSKFKKWHEKLLTIFLIVGTTIYSGIGISIPSVDNSYVFIFFLFIVFEGTGLMIGYRMFGEKQNNQMDSISYVANSYKLISFLAVIYWLIIIILLFYPTNHMRDLFSIRLDITGVIESRIAKRSNYIVYILGLLSKIIMPFYCIYLSKQSKGKIVFLILLESYLITVIDGYIGRTALMMLLVEVILVILLVNDKANDSNSRKKIIIRVPGFTSHKKETDENKHNIIQFKKAILIFAIGFVLAIPFLVSYQFSRHGQVYSGTSFSDSLLFLFDSEISFPKYYLKCENLKGMVISPLEYLYWFITLPIPKELLFLPKATTITYTFSSMVRGVNFGQTGFSVLLPSLLGEGILLWGKNLCFIHALFIGTVWGAINSYLAKHNELFIFQILFIARTLNMVRGGTQGSIATIINGLVPFAVICFLIFNIMRSSYRHRF